MSTLKTNNVQVGQSVTATNNFTLYQPATPDGTVRLGVGNSGATTADVLTLNGNGALALRGAVTSASGVGITFPATQSASTDANTLDDYEEGTWTPEIRFGGAAVGVTYSGNRNGRYTKIGRIVTVAFYMELTNKGSSTGNLTVVTLPFVPYNATGYPYYVGTVANEANMASMPTGVFCLAWSDSNLYIRSNNATAWTAVTNSNLTNTSTFYCTITYEAV
jgi:hypothetical protein